MELIKSKAIENGVCCNSCQEDVNIHGCISCGKDFEHNDIIYCEHHSHSDCLHYHENCKPKTKSNKEKIED